MRTGKEHVCTTLKYLAEIKGRVIQEKLKDDEGPSLSFNFSLIFHIYKSQGER